MSKHSFKGFTLIEIVVVIAIAGLIMGLVFTSIAGAQKARRDQQRKNDANRLFAAIQTYASNNKGALPPYCRGVCNPVGALYWAATDPSTGAAYVMSPDYSAGVTPLGTMFYPGSGYICNAANNDLATGTAVTFVLITGLESGGAYCRDNR